MAPKKTITVEEAAEQLGMDASSVRKLIRRGKISAERRGEKIWDVDAASVAQYARGRKPAGRPVGTISDKPAESKKFGKGTPRAEEEREYQRIYRREYRAGIRRRSS